MAGQKLDRRGAELMGGHVGKGRGGVVAPGGTRVKGGLVFCRLRRELD